MLHLHSCASTTCFLFMQNIKAKAACSCKTEDEKPAVMFAATVWDLFQVRSVHGYWGSCQQFCQGWLTKKKDRKNVIHSTGSSRITWQGRYNICAGYQATANLFRFCFIYRMCVSIFDVSKLRCWWHEWWMNKTSHGMFAPVFYCGFSSLVTQKGSLGSSYIYHISHIWSYWFTSLGTKKKKKAIPFFIQTRKRCLALVLWNPLSAQLHSTSRTS